MKKSIDCSEKLTITIWGCELENHVTPSRDEKTDTTIELPGVRLR